MFQYCDKKDPIKVLWVTICERMVSYGKLGPSIGCLRRFLKNGTTIPAARIAPLTLSLESGNDPVVSDFEIWRSRLPTPLWYVSYHIELRVALRECRLGYLVYLALGYLPYA